MESLLKRFERIIIVALLGMMMLVVLLGTVELAVILVEELFKPKIFLLDINKLLRIFGFFMMILIGIELIETIKVYLVEESVHVEIIFLVAIIAVTRKVIILDIKELEPLTLIGIAAVTIALSVGYYVLKKALHFRRKQ